MDVRPEWDLRGRGRVPAGLLHVWAIQRQEGDDGSEMVMVCGCLWEDVGGREL